MKSHERISEMHVDTREIAQDRNHYGGKSAVCRVLAGAHGWLGSGPGWELLRQTVGSSGRAGNLQGECWLIEIGEVATIPLDELKCAGLPIVLAVASDGRCDVDPAMFDYADGIIFEDDDPATIAEIFERAVAPGDVTVVRDLSDGTTRMINALSAEAGRIANELARLAEAQRSSLVETRPIDALMIRRLLRMRRERDRFFPAELFADPAWDMLLDLAAAQLEGKLVPVSSLCIAAAVPTTTALRWVRSLSQARLLERQIDPTDARRSHIRLSHEASSAILAYLRLFNDAFAMR